MTMNSSIASIASIRLAAAKYAAAKKAYGDYFRLHAEARGLAELLPRKTTGRHMRSVDEVLKRFHARLGRVWELETETARHFRNEIMSACKDAIHEVVLINRYMSKLEKLGLGNGEDIDFESYIHRRDSDSKRLHGNCGEAMRAFTDAFVLECIRANEKTASGERCAYVMKSLGYERDDELRDALSSDYRLVSGGSNAHAAVDILEGDTLFINKSLGLVVVLRRDITEMSYRISYSGRHVIGRADDSGAIYLPSSEHLEDTLKRAWVNGACGIFVPGKLIENSEKIEALSSRLLESHEETTHLSKVRRELMIRAPALTGIRRLVDAHFFGRGDMTGRISDIARGAHVSMALHELATDGVRDMRGAYIGLHVHGSDNGLEEKCRVTPLHIILP